MAERDLFQEVKSFLIFQMKVLKNQKNRMVTEPGQPSQYTVSKNMGYELNKLMQFLDMQPPIKLIFDQEYSILNLIASSLNEGSQQDPAKAQSIFEKLQELDSQIRQKADPAKNQNTI